MRRRTQIQEAEAGDGRWWLGAWGRNENNGRQARDEARARTTLADRPDCRSDKCPDVLAKRMRSRWSKDADLEAIDGDGDNDRRRSSKSQPSHAPAPLPICPVPPMLWASFGENPAKARRGGRYRTHRNRGRMVAGVMTANFSPATLPLLAPQCGQGLACF